MRAKSRLFYDGAILSRHLHLVKYSRHIRIANITISDRRCRRKLSLHPTPHIMADAIENWILDDWMVLWQRLKGAIAVWRGSPIRAFQ